METLLLIISLLLIIIVLLQSGKAESASNIVGGSNASLFANRKERSGELIITRITALLGAAFMVISVIIGML